MAGAGTTGAEVGVTDVSFVKPEYWEIEEDEGDIATGVDNINAGCILIVGIVAMQWRLVVKREALKRRW